MNEVIEARHGTPALKEVKVELRKIVARAMRDYARTENYLDMADAAIAAMWPVMREMCAGVVETFIDGGGGPGDGIAELAAETIRKLEQPK